MDLKLFSEMNRERCESPTGFNHKLFDWMTPLLAN